MWGRTGVSFALVLSVASMGVFATGKSIAAEAVPGYVEPPAASASPFQAPWTHVSETSAVIYWHVAGMSREASDSYVEYGETAEYGKQTTPMVRPTTTAVRQPNTRWAHLHWIKGLEPGKTYHYRMVMTLEGKKVSSADATFETKKIDGAVYVPGDLAGPPFTLDEADTTYVLTEDITAPEGAFVIAAAGVRLDLDGHTVTFGERTDHAAHGILPTGRANGKVTICNGHIRQGKQCGQYSCAINSNSRAFPLEICGVSTDVYLKNAYPLRLFRSARDVEIHHNHLYSRVTKIQSRHYPGNDLLRIDRATNVSIHHNLLTEGCHRGITMSGNDAVEAGNREIYENDIRHHQQYVNGHAFVGVSYAKVHHNHVTSTGRGMQIGRNVEIYGNWFDIQGHMTLSDMPQGSNDWKRRRVELHGFKFEGRNCVNNKIHDNFIRITQHLPNDKWDYVPATPLNISSYNPNAMNEVYKNTIVALTRYKQTRHGPYGDSGQWASAIFFVGMTKGPAEAGKYSVYVHHNRFISNDLFVSASHEPNMTIRIEDNAFVLGENPVAGHAVFRRIPPDMQQRIKTSNNTFEGMKP